MTTAQIDPTRFLKVSAAQFAASTEWEENVAIILPLIEQAHTDGVQLLVLPEGVLARFMGEKSRIRAAAQSLDGPFVTALREATVGKSLTVIVGIHEKSAEERPYNTLVALRDGEIVTVYRKLHLYDAFAALESDNVLAADLIPELLDVDGFKIGLMTCYDVRFPELARLLTVAGADALVLPAAWAKGPSKEFHWSTLVSARSLDNTVYMIASGEAGDACIGNSMITDPLGLPLVMATNQPTTITTVLSKDRLAAARSSLPVLSNRRFDISTTPRSLTAPVSGSSITE